jgi:hypothetical protein
VHRTACALRMVGIVIVTLRDCEFVRAAPSIPPWLAFALALQTFIVNLQPTASRRRLARLPGTARRASPSLARCLARLLHPTLKVKRYETDRCRFSIVIHKQFLFVITPSFRNRAQLFNTLSEDHTPVAFFK